MKFIRKIYKYVAVWLVLTMLSQIVAPTVAYALTGGPTQPEVSSFEPVGTSENVDLSTGDFNYNIPLLDVEGYPINIAYHGGVTMDQEASWVGLGWNINPGSVNRNMRGIPDDFGGDTIERVMHVKPNTTVGFTLGGNFELFGFSSDNELAPDPEASPPPFNGDSYPENDSYEGSIVGDVLNQNRGSSSISLSLSLGVSQNSYRGIGVDFGLGVTKKVQNANESSSEYGLSLNSSSQNGVELSRSVSQSSGAFKIADRESYNSMDGLKQLSFSASASLLNVSASLPVGTPTYIPEYSLPLRNTGLTIDVNAGIELFGGQPNIRGGGYYTAEYLVDTVMRLPAFGYMYAERARGYTNLIQDFNREKDEPFTRYKKRLPVTNQTYDVYSATGQGIGASIRPHRSDVGVMYDNEVQNKSNEDNAGVELGFTELFKLGLNIGFTHSDSRSGTWSNNDAKGITDIFKFRNGSEMNQGFEPYYFKAAGETTTGDRSIFNELGGSTAAAVNIEGAADVSTITNRIVVRGKGPQTVNASNLYLKSRDKRMENVSILNNAESTSMPEFNQVDNYPISKWRNKTAATKIRRVNDSKAASPKSHHIGQMTVTKPGGTRYVYGLPAYNNTTEETSFAANVDNTNTGFTTYGTNDNTINNANGRDNYYSKSTIPAYAHSYLLTSVLSPDYQDLTGDGVTDDDYGTATKINYTRINADYRWRAPYEHLKASYNEGLKTRIDDQHASYIYGSKELWYVSSIESKNYIAEFYSSPREDGLGVLNNNGGKNISAREYKLDSIKLFAKQDIIRNGTHAQALKSVVFEYNYELCPYVPNNTNKWVDKTGSTPGDTSDATKNVNAKHGKLTLKKIYFKFGNSNKGKLNPYQFYYADPTHSKTIDTLSNPRYNAIFYDRWGSFKPTYHGSLTNYEYPYVDQDSADYKANVYASAWSLNTIVLPSGGLVKVDYESDDYAYVQDQRAMQMFKILDTEKDNGSGGLTSGGGLLFADNTANLLNLDGKKYDPYLYLKVKLPYAVTSLDTLKDRYLNGITDLYFKCFVNLKEHYPTGDFVKGYARIDINGCKLDAGDHTIAYIKLRPESMNNDDYFTNNNVNPISKAAWQFTALNNSDLIKGTTQQLSANLQEAITGMATALTTQIPMMIEGRNRYMRNNLFADKIVPNKSFIRLYSPTFRKYGGGARVKKIAMNDAWNDITGSYASEYGQTYKYSSVSKEHGVISSGVASYEPMIGNEENPLRKPIPYPFLRTLGTNDMLYDEGPFGESFFPAPQVIYSTVKVTNIKPAGKETEIKRTGTGYTVYEFYTARDFPVKLDNTNIQQKEYHPHDILYFLNLATHDKTTVSQGYSIELNDMTGKLKAVWQYSENQPEFDNTNSRVKTALSGVEYIYKTKNNNNHDLDNNVTVIDSNGVVESDPLMAGVDFDCVLDTRESFTKTNGTEVGANTDGMTFGFIPFIMFMLWPQLSEHTTQFRSAVMTKVITKTAILEKVVYHDNGQSTASVNEIWDKETGQVVVQKTYNEFNDSIYHFYYPAHWVYDRMGAAYKNEGVVLRKLTIGTDGSLIDNSAGQMANYLVPGDVVCLYDQPFKTHDVDAYNRKPTAGPFWVYQAHGKFFLIDRQGQIYKGFKGSSGTITSLPQDLKIIHSGRKNMPGAPVGTLVARNKLFSSHSLTFDNIINAGAAEYADNWQTYCCGYVPLSNGTVMSLKDAMGDVVNPYLTNISGNWRTKRDYAFIGDRTFTNSHYIRTEGNFRSFSPFWTFSSGNWTAARNSKKWQWKTEITKCSPFGNELETRDTLGRYNAALFGYNFSLNTALASNAHYNDIAFDGFEDYNYAKMDIDPSPPTTPPVNYAYTNYLPHFGFYAPYSNNLSFLAKDTSHTGRYSIRVESASNLSFDRDLNIGSSCTYTTDTLHRLRLDECIGRFSPTSNGKYVLSAWVKVNNSDSDSYNNTSIGVTIKRASLSDTSFTLKPAGNIIEGWQRIESSFFIPSSATRITVKFNADNSYKTYFDDLRIFPANANMKSFVYDAVSLRLKATLDENNYATFYEYDVEGNLIRTKQETENGIFTVQESRKHLRTNPNP